jgi:dienelactone hydrolase
MRAVGLCLLIVLSPSLSQVLRAQTADLTVAPASARIDEPVHVVLNGLPPAQKVMLRSVMRVDSASAIVAAGVYVTDSLGVVNLERDAARSGTYTGIEPMGLFWSGRQVPLDSLAREDIPSSEFDPPRPYSVVITASVNDTVVARTTVTRTFGAENVIEEEVRSGDVVARLFVPRTVPDAPVVIVLGGSEGGYESSAYEARLLAAHGFAVLAQAYFRAPGLNEELASIPVERVQRAIEWLRHRPDISAERVAIIGSSRGTELALLSAGLNPGVRAVIVYGTSVTTGGGLTSGGEPHREAAWTLGGQPLPVMQISPSPEALAQFSSPDPVRLRLLFEPGLSDVQAVERAAIPVENIRADVLIISGTDDQMGPVDIAGDMLVERLARAGHQGRRVHLKYPEAGHLIGIPFTPTTLRLTPWRFAVGGSVQGYARADAESWPQVIRFLRQSLGVAGH